MTANTFFTSDTHAYHKNIMKFCPQTRQGADYIAMTELLIQAHNKTVTPNSTVYFLGDFSFGSADQTRAFLSRLNGRKHLIYGNHDKVIRNNVDIQRMFETVQEYRELNLMGKKLVLFHYPMIEWNGMHRGAYHLFGHVHGGLDHLPNGRSMDVGIDTRTDMCPWSFEEIHAVLEKRPVVEHVHRVQE